LKNRPGSIWKKSLYREALINTEQLDERAVLVGVDIKGSKPAFTVESSLDELALLAQTAGVEVQGRMIQRLSRVDQSTFIGSGKLEELTAMLPELNANMVIFDDELSPRHQRELEKALGDDIQVLDRSALILDIFAQHARTREGNLQVELAQYEYRLPRLTRLWTHLARQAGGGAGRGGTGGVGLRGPGETQLEVDRREIRKRITKLKQELETVRAHRQRHRLQRVRAGMPTVALVGYTNAGKSTLLNAISGADVYVANQLFATLDPTTRRIKLPNGRAVLLSDTVGFIQKLPVTLVAAFRATLEEVVEADLLLHVVDASHPLAWDQIDVVEDTLAELEATRIPKILVLNKIDRGVNLGDVDLTGFGYQGIVQVSAIKNMGLDKLLEAVGNALASDMESITLTIPYAQGDLLAAIHNSGIVDSETHSEKGVTVDARVPTRLAGRLKQMLSGEDEIKP
jgi:GTP-binding protein HflX